MNKFSSSLLTFFPKRILGRYTDLPEDLVDVSDSVMKQYQASPPEGQRLGSDSNGQPIWVDVDLPSAAELRTIAKDKIDLKAGEVRLSYVSAGHLVVAEYRLALQQVQDWRLAGSPANAVPAAVSGWSSVAGLTAEDAAADIEQTAAAWDQVLIGVRNIRLQGKAAIESAADNADFGLIAQPFIDQLDALAP